MFNVYSNFINDKIIFVPSLITANCHSIIINCKFYANILQLLKVNERKINIENYQYII